MKFLITLSFLLPLLTGFQASAFLTPDQSEKVIAALNDACADNWCEGVYDVRFDSIRCSSVSRSCLLRMTMKDSYDEKAEPKSHACILEPVNSVHEIFNATYVGLSVEFTSIVSKCIASYAP